MNETKEKSANVVSHVNHVRVSPLQYCCGMWELGNFNYIDLPGSKSMTHFHKMSGWSSQRSRPDDPTTYEDVANALKPCGNAGVVCTTGSGQEYMDSVLVACGFEHVSTFVNPGHAQTPVKVWTRSPRRE